MRYSTLLRLVSRLGFRKKRRNGVLCIGLAGVSIAILLSSVGLWRVAKKTMQNRQLVLSQSIFKDKLYARSSETIGITLDMWNRVNAQIRPASLYGPDFDWKAVNKMLLSVEITQAWLFSPNEKEYKRVPQDLGSTHKWFLHLAGGAKAIFKPFWSVLFCFHCSLSHPMPSQILYTCKPNFITVS